MPGVSNRRQATRRSSAVPALTGGLAAHSRRTGAEADAYSSLFLNSRSKALRASLWLRGESWGGGSLSRAVGCIPPGAAPAPAPPLGYIVPTLPLLLTPIPTLPTLP